MLEHLFYMLVCIRLLNSNFAWIQIDLFELEIELELEKEE